MKLDAALKADQLTFSIKREWVPTAMYEKAAKYLADPMKYVKVVDNPNPQQAAQAARARRSAVRERGVEAARSGPLLRERHRARRGGRGARRRGHIGLQRGVAWGCSPGAWGCRSWCARSHKG